MSLGRWIGRHAYLGLHDIVGPVWVITMALFESIEYRITVSYSDSTFGYIQFIPVSTSLNMQARHKMR